MILVFISPVLDLGNCNNLHRIVMRQLLGGTVPANNTDHGVTVNFTPLATLPLNIPLLFEQLDLKDPKALIEYLHSMVYIIWSYSTYMVHSV